MFIAWLHRTHRNLPALGAAWLTMCISGTVIGNLVNGDNSLLHLRDDSYLIAAQQAVSVVAAALAIAVVLGIDKRQTLAYDALCAKSDTIGSHYDEPTS